MPVAQPSRPVGATRPRAESSPQPGSSLAGRARWSRIVPLCALTVVGVLLSGCGGSGTHLQSPPSSPSTPTANSPASPTANDPAQQAKAVAIRQVQTYERTLDALASDPKLPLDRLYTVTTQPNVTDEVAFFNRFRAAGNRQHGVVRIVSARVDGGVQSSQKGSTLHVTACIDVTHVRAVDRHGKSIVPKQRKPFYLTRFLLADPKYPTKQAWLITKVTADEVTSCRA